MGERAAAIINDIISRIEKDDPAQRDWCVQPTGKLVVSCDASCYSIAVVIEQDNVIIKDKAWL